MKKIVFVLLCLEGAILSFNVAACAALVPSIAKDFSVPQFLAGKIVWLYMLAYGVSALFYGPAVKFFDARKIELACFFLFSLANLLAAFSNNITLLFWARLFMGMFGASVIPLVLILIAKHTTPENRGRLVGVFFGATFVASLLGLFLSGVIPWRLIFLIPAIMGFMLWVAMYIFLPSFKEDRSGIRVNYAAALKNRAVLSIFTYIFLISLFYHGIQQWLGVYFSKEFNFNQFIISMLITLTSLSGIFGEVLGGWLSDALGRFKTIELGIILMIISVFSLIFKLPVGVLALIMMVWGLGWTFNHAGLSTALVDLPKDFLNEAASLNSSVRFIAGGLGAAAGGLMLQKSFSLGFSIFGISLIMLAILSRSLLIIKEGDQEWARI